GYDRRLYREHLGPERLHLVLEVQLLCQQLLVLLGTAFDGAGGFLEQKVDPPLGVGDAGFRLQQFGAGGVFGIFASRQRLTKFRGGGGGVVGAAVGGLDLPDQRTVLRLQEGGALAFGLEPDQQQVDIGIVVAGQRLAVDLELLRLVVARGFARLLQDRKSTRLNSSHVKISYAVFCLKKKRTYSRSV